MTDPSPAVGRRLRRVAQLLLLAAAGLLWGGSRLPWVTVRCADGLGRPREVILLGSTWSTALVPLAVLAVAAALATVAVHGWPLRVLAVLTGAASLAAGYLGIGLWATPEVGARGMRLAEIPVAALSGTERHYVGASLAAAAAVAALLGAALLMRSASLRAGVADDTERSRYLPPRARGGGNAPDPAVQAENMSEQMIWDALDRGVDPTGSNGSRAGRSGA